MGWKTVKEHYRIGHCVQVTEEGICIGSSFIPEIIVIGLDGVVKKRYNDQSNNDLARYQAEMDADPDKLLKLIQSPDEFINSIAVYTYEGGEIIEKQCEALGWPNVTHDGLLMYDNTFFAGRGAAIDKAKSNAESLISYTDERIKETIKLLDELNSKLASFKQDLLSLEALDDV